MVYGRRRKKRNRLLIAALAAVLLAAAAFVYFATDLFRVPEPSAPPASPSPSPQASAAPLPAGAPSVPPTDQATPSLVPTAQRSLYEAALTVFADAKTPYVKGALRLTYVNNSADLLYEVKLHLFPNDVRPGCMGVSDVAVDNEVAYYTLDGANESILSIPLASEIAPGESATIYLRFEIGLPITGNRFGVNGVGIMLGNTLPIAAVYENGGWRTDRYTFEGDAFYSECADYRVAVSAPSSWELAHTGSLIEGTESDGVSTWYIVAPESRDFAMALLKEPFIETRTTAAGTTVYAFGMNRKHAEYEADAAVAALDYFGANIGAYPYDTFFVVPFDMGGGMEYPGLIMICEQDLHAEDLSEAALVIGHEAAHQWFYSVVGSDQINAPWLDESLVEYLGFDFLGAYLGTDVTTARRETRFASLKSYERVMRIDSALYDFSGSDYFRVVYGCGYMMYDELYGELGHEAFYEALRTYFNANSFSIADKENLYAAFSEVAGRDMSQWFEERLAPPAA